MAKQKTTQKIVKITLAGGHGRGSVSLKDYIGKLVVIDNTWRGNKELITLIEENTVRTMFRGISPSDVKGIYVGVRQIVDYTRHVEDNFLMEKFYRKDVEDLAERRIYDTLDQMLSEAGILEWPESMGWLV